MNQQNKPVHLILSSTNQESMSQQLMNSIRDEILKPEYDHLYVSTLIGILEMLKLEQYERIKRRT